jgi:hypothetical protein
MQPRAPVAALIFLASYLPLAMILALQDLDLTILRQPICPDWGHFSKGCAVPLKHPGMAMAPLAVCLICLLVTLFALAKVQPRTPIVIKSAKHVPADLMNYTLPYIVTLMSLDYSDLAKLAGFATFLAWIFVITLRSGQLLMNPVLAVFGWQLYEVRFTYAGGSATERESVALVKGECGPDTTVAHQTIQDILVIKAGS